MTLAANLRSFVSRPALAPLRAALHDALHPPAPSARVARAIAETEQTSEILVDWVQLAGVTLFLVLYALSRGAFAMEKGVEPAPIALAIYGAFVVWRLTQAYCGPLSRRALIASAAADVFVLMLLIWSFTLQYDAPPALYLKAPTLLYVFILIALRALRFEPALVLLTGALAVLGWLTLVMIAANAGTPVTNDYRAYMTSLSLLWGAEAEKLAAIGAVTLVLALAVSRARTLLIRTAIEQTAADDLSRFLDPSAARRVRSAETALQPGDGELKPAAIMFLDLRGFSTAAATLPAKDVIAILHEYQSAFVPIVEAAGGSVDKYLGDGILVSFGTAEMTGREAAQALTAVPALLQASEAWIASRKARGHAPLQVAIAITTGDVIHGVIGHDDRLEFTVIGDAVNNAAKLEKHAKIERAKVICTREALTRARAQGATVTPLREANASAVEGIAGPIDLAIIA